MITCIIIKTCCKRLLHVHDSHSPPSQSAHTARRRRAHGALEDPTTLPLRPYSALSNGLRKSQAATLFLSMLKIIALADGRARTQRC